MKYYDVIVIGAGIAGMTAAIYARRAGKTVLVFEGKAYGGQIINTLNIENWPGDYGVSGVDLSQKIYHQMNNLGAEIEFDEVTEVLDRDKDGHFVVKTESEEYSCSDIIIAVGAEDKKAGFPREEEMTGRGVSYCATCDGAFYKDKDVAVIGGGNTALYDASYLSNIAKKVYLVHRRDEFRGDSREVEKLQKCENVEFVLGYVPKEVLGDKKVEGLVVAPSGKVEDAVDERRLDASGIFVAVGKKPMTEIFAGLVELDENGYIVAGEDCKTTHEGIYAVGDCRTKDVRQLVTAAADGAVAASNL